FVVHFDPMKGQFPEGFTLHKGNAYIGFPTLGTIVQVSLGRGTVTPYASVPPPASDHGQPLGLTLDIIFDANDNLYVLQTAFDPTRVMPGIYKIPPGGGNATALFAQDPKMLAPNGVDIDAQGNLFVADTSGLIFRVAPSGAVGVWSQDPLLHGD